MDQDGLFLMLKMCNGCSHNKGSWKKCMSRRHNPRMSTVRKEELTFGHRQCVKPDQAITIYKLRDHETNEEFLEFDEQVIFQTACPACLNIKSCLKSGHKLVDWRPTFAGGRVAGTPLSPPPSPRRVTPPDVAPGGGGGRGGRGRKKEGEGVKGGVGAPASGGRSKGGRRRSSAGAAGAAAADDHDGGGGGGGDGDDGDGEGAGGAGMNVSSPSRRARGSLEGNPHAKAAPKSSHKRKSPGSSASDLAKNLKISAPRSVSVPEIPKPASLAANKPTARRVRGNNSNNTAPGGATKKNRRKSGEAAGVTPKMEIDTSASSSEANERPLKRRGKQALPAAVTPSPKTEGQESFQACSAGEEEEEGEEEEAAPHGDEGVVATPTIVAKIVPKTVAEKLEMVKSEEAELLRQFEDTHNRCAQEEESKRAEMVEFQRAGEAALCAMQEEKEELLRRISEERKTKAAERGALLRERLKEFEAEEVASRAEAKERDARLEAEKEMLSRECKADLASTAAAAAAAAAGAGSLSSIGNGDWTAPSGGGGGDGSVGIENGTCGTGTDPDAPASSKTSDEARASAAAAAAAMAEAQAAMSMSMSMSMSTTSMSTSTTVATVEESADDDLAERNGISSAADPSASSKAALLTEEATKSSKRASSPAKAVLSGRGAGKACNGGGGGLSSTRSSAAVATASLAKAGPGGGGGEGMNFDAPGVELVSPDVSEPETGFPYEGGVVPADEDAPGSATDMPDEVGNAEREDGEEGRANGVSPGVGRSKGPASVAVQ